MKDLNKNIAILKELKIELNDEFDLKFNNIKLIKQKSDFKESAFATIIILLILVSIYTFTYTYFGEKDNLYNANRADYIKSLETNYSYNLNI